MAKKKIAKKYVRVTFWLDGWKKSTWVRMDKLERVECVSVELDANKIERVVKATPLREPRRTRSRR